MRWASHQDGDSLWWICTLDHIHLNAYAVTCAHCLKRKGWECSALRKYKCPGPYKWRPKLVRVYCYLCHKIHMPRELVNNRVCWRQALAHRCKILHNNILKVCDIRPINNCKVSCTDYYKR